jgi:hypothetical protein
MSRARPDKRAVFRPNLRSVPPPGLIYFDRTRPLRQLSAVAEVVPMVVPRDSLLIVAGGGSPHLAPLNCNGQRWCVLAVRDYESRALPLSYGGGPLT